MKGKVLDFSIADGHGAISGDDGNRYHFPGMEWKVQTRPIFGMRVDFVADGGNARGVYLDDDAKPTVLQRDDLGYEGFYRSQDDKMVAGVCAGLAHKWNFSRGGMRFTTFLLTIFLFVPLLIYVVLWMIFPALPTKYR